MAGKRKDMKDVKALIALLNQGYGSKHIAKVVGCSKNTVKTYKRAAESKGVSFAELLKLEDAQIEQFFKAEQPEDTERRAVVNQTLSSADQELEKKGMTLYLLWEEYKLSHPDGYSYPQFCRLYQKQAVNVNCSMHMEHKPGDKLYLDYTGKKIDYVDKETGEILQAEVFVASMGYSDKTYVEAVASQKQEDFARCVTNALEYFGGVPAALVPDNLKSAVIIADKYEAELNALLSKLAAHYGCAVAPARSLKPQDKAIVERHVTIVYQRIFARMRNMTFFSVSDINDAIKPLTEDVNNRNFQRRPFSRNDLFEEEKPYLKPLPQYPFEIMVTKTVTVMKNTHVQLSEDSHYYSVPFKYIGIKVQLSYNSREVIVFVKGVQVAYHLRDRAPYKYTTVTDHLPSSHQYVTQWSPDFFISEAAKVSETVCHYITMILGRKDYPEHMYKSCMGILGLGKRLGNDRLIKACKLGARANVYSYTFIKSTLQNKTEDLADTMPEVSHGLPEHENIRGAEHYKQQLSNSL